MAISCLCGIIYDVEPMLRSESITQHINAVLNCFGDELKLQNAWWVDKACQILQRLLSTQQISEFEHTLILVDRFNT